MDPCGEWSFGVVGIHEVELCDRTIDVGFLIYPDASVGTNSGDPDPKV